MEITLGCYQCVDIVHLLFIVSGSQKKKKKSIASSGYLLENLILFYSEKKLCAVSTKEIFTIRLLKALETILHMAALPPEHGAVWLMSNDEIYHLLSSLIHGWIMVATCKYKSQLLRDKLEMGSAVSNGLGNQKKTWTKTQNMHWP